MKRIAVCSLLAVALALAGVSAFQGPAAKPAAPEAWKGEKWECCYLFNNGNQAIFVEDRGVTRCDNWKELSEKLETGDRGEDELIHYLAILNKLGRLGWEPVSHASLSGSEQLTFKRRKPQ